MRGKDVNVNSFLFLFCNSPYIPLFVRKNNPPDRKQRFYDKLLPKVVSNWWREKIDLLLDNRVAVMDLIAFSLMSFYYILPAIQKFFLT
jgi:hypothetical protein